MDNKGESQGTTIRSVFDSSDLSPQINPSGSADQLAESVTSITFRPLLNDLESVCLGKDPEPDASTPGMIASAGPIRAAHLPGDKVNLKLILVSGKTHEFLFVHNDSASQITSHVYENWPVEWAEDKVESANVLKLIYHGRFLHGNVTLGALSLPLGRTTVMHLVARENLPEPNSQDNLKKSKSSCCNCCSIL